MPKLCLSTKIYFYFGFLFICIFLFNTKCSDVWLRKSLLNFAAANGRHIYDPFSILGICFKTLPSLSCSPKRLSLFPLMSWIILKSMANKQANRKHLWDGVATDRSKSHACFGFSSFQQAFTLRMKRDVFGRSFECCLFASSLALVIFANFWHLTDKF